MAAAATTTVAATMIGGIGEEIIEVVEVEALDAMIMTDEIIAVEVVVVAAEVAHDVEMTTTTMIVEVIAVAVAVAGDLLALIAAIIDAAAWVAGEHPPPVEYNSIPTRRNVIGSMIAVGSVGDARAYLMSNQRRSNLLRMRPERH